MRSTRGFPECSEDTQHAVVSEAALDRTSSAPGFIYAKKYLNAIAMQWIKIVSLCGNTGYPATLL